MDSQPSAPPVVAVVVATEQGDWFEDGLAALGAQDYPNQSVLVIDAGRAGDATSRVAKVLPDAYLRRPIEGPGFAVLANDALTTVQGSAFLLFCHDDVAPAPDAIRLLVEEALRSNAGIVGPKLVDWNDPARLLEVGLAVDRMGATASLVDRGELDQEQHDAVRDVFAISSACMLARTDLFVALKGFDPALGDHGADLDLCWRAQVAGARVMVVPAARARHREGGAEQPGHDPDRLRLEARNHLRTMLKTYSAFTLVRVVPQAAIATIGEAGLALANGRWAEARALAGAWAWNLRRLGQIRALRRTVRTTRAVPDGEVRRLQVRGSVHLTAFFRRQLRAEDRARALLTAGQELVGRAGKGPAQAATGLLAVLVLAMLVGSRHLIAGPLPAVGQFLPLPGVGTLFSSFVHGWRTTGMGAAAAAPPAFALLGAGGVALLGHVAQLQKLLVLASWPVAAVGAWHLGRRFSSGLGRIVLVVVYLAVPLSYNSVARGHMDGLIAYAVAPWVLSRLARLARLDPFAAGGDDPAWRRLGLLGFALGLAVALALAPSVAFAVLLTGVGLLLGCVLTGDSRGGSRALGSAVIAVAGAVALLLPWAWDLLVPGRAWSTVVGVAPPASQAFGLGALLRFQVGPLGAPVLGWAFVVAAALPLVLAHGARLAWAVRCWAVVLVCVGVAWAGGRHWLPLQLQAPDVILAPAALAMAAAAALGAAAFEADLPRYRFGWRQVASLVAGAAVVAGALPIFGAVSSGRWNLASPELAQSLSWMGPRATDGAYRVLWLGDPEVLPLAGWSLGDGLAYATSRDGVPDYTDLQPGPASDATRQIGAAVNLAERGDTARLGRLLAPMAVRYLVLPGQLAAGERKGTQRRPPPGLSRALQSQLDLRLLPADPAAVVYENTAWGPGRELLPAGVTASGVPVDLDGGADLSGARPVLEGDGPVRFAGPLPAEGQVLLSETTSSRWALSVDGRRIPHQTAFGVANAYASAGPGPAVASFQTPPLHYLAIAVELALWALAIRAVHRLRRRRRSTTSGPATSSGGAADTPTAAPAAGTTEAATPGAATP